jgi:hypothetical protein
MLHKGRKSGIRMAGWQSGHSSGSALRGAAGCFRRGSRSTLRPSPSPARHPIEPEPTTRATITLHFRALDVRTEELGARRASPVAVVDGDRVAGPTGGRDRHLPPVSFSGGGRPFRIRLGNGARGTIHCHGSGLQQPLRGLHWSNGVGTAALSIPDRRGVQAFRSLFQCFGVAVADHQQPA